MKDWHQFLPPATMDVHEQHLNEFFVTMHKRQQIWWMRFTNAPREAWTDDPILRDYKFCNVYRELDRSSQYLIQNVYLDRSCSFEQIVFSILAHRIYNKPETFIHLGYPQIKNYNETNWLKRLQVLEQAGIKALNQEAYKINTYMWSGEPRWQAYTRHILSRFASNIKSIVKLVRTGTATQLTQELRKYCGAFLTHEFYQDFCDLNTYFKEGTVRFDKNRWTNAGPGAKGGLRLIFPSLPEERAEEGLCWLHELSVEMLPKVSQNSFKYLNWNRLKQCYEVSTIGETDLHMQEMWACEFFKYWRMKLKVGKQRQQYCFKGNEYYELCNLRESDKKS